MLPAFIDSVMCLCMNSICHCVNNHLNLECLFGRLEVYSREELLEEYLWRPETEEEKGLTGQFLPCPFLRELGACNRVRCRVCVMPLLIAKHGFASNAVALF